MPEVFLFLNIEKNWENNYNVILYYDDENKDKN